ASTPSSRARFPSPRRTMRASAAWPTWPAATTPANATVRQPLPPTWRQRSASSTASSTSPTPRDGESTGPDQHGRSRGDRQRERPALRREVVVVGDMATLRRAARLGGVAPDSAEGGLVLAGLDEPAQWAGLPRGAVGVLQAGEALAPPPWGRVSAVAGRAAAA